MDDKGITRPPWWEGVEAHLRVAADAGWLTWRAQGSGRVYRMAEDGGPRRTVNHREGLVLAELLRRRALTHETDEGFAYVNRQGRVVRRRG